MSTDLRRARWLTRALFGVRVPGATTQGHWDLTTLVLRRALDRIAVPGMRVLEMGCGEAAVLSVHAARTHAARVIAADVSADAIERARRAFAANGVAVDARVSDLFAGIRADEAFDAILFNPPYVPTAFGRDRGLDEPPRVWDGGADGADVIRRFLGELSLRMGAGTRVLLGFNSRHVPEALVAGEAAGRGLSVHDRVTTWWNPAVVLVLVLVPVRAVTSSTSRSPSRGRSG